MKTNDSIEKVVFIISLSILFTFGLMYRIIDERILALFLTPICGYYIIRREASLLDFQFLFLFMAYSFIAVYAYRDNPFMRLKFSSVVYFWVMPVVYLFGKLVVGESKREASKRIFTVITTLSIGMFAQSMLDYYYKVKVPIVGRGHLWLAFWDHETQVRNTYDLGFILVSASMLYAFINRKNNKGFFWFTVVAECIALVLNVINQGRLNICILVLVFVVMLGFYSYNYWDEFSKTWKRVIVSFGAIMITFFAAISFAISHGLIDSGDDENVKFLGRGGGILGNIRFKMALEGLKDAFLYEKGGWEITVGDTYQTHNTWLEYARVYDNIIFSVLTVFVLICLIIGVKLLINFGKNNSEVYYVVGSLFALFLYFTMEPNGFANKRFSLLFFLMCGLTSGFYEVLCTGDYQKLNYVNQPHSLSKSLHIDLSSWFLCYALLNLAYIDFYSNRLAMLETCILPMVAYFIGKHVKQEKVLIGFLAAICIMLFGYTYLLSHNEDFFAAGYCIEPISKSVMEKGVMLELMIIPVSLIIGAVLFKIGINKLISSIIVCAGSLITMKIYSTNGRLHIIKESIGLFYQQPWGSFTVTSSPTGTTNSVWLDYARDYGFQVAVFMLIAIFILGIQFMLFIIKKEETDYVDYALISAFIMFCILFTLDSSAFNRYLFSIGLVIFGMMKRRIVLSNTL